MLRRTKLAHPVKITSDLADRKQATMLLHGVAVSHAGDVVGYGTRLLFGMLILWRQLAGIIKKRGEEIADDSPRLVRHAQYLIVAIEVHAQKSLELPVFLGQRWRKRGEWWTLPECVDAVRCVGSNVIGSGFHQVTDQRIDHAPYSFVNQSTAGKPGIFLFNHSNVTDK